MSKNDQPQIQIINGLRGLNWCMMFPCAVPWGKWRLQRTMQIWRFVKVGLFVKLFHVFKSTAFHSIDDFKDKILKCNSEFACT